MLGKRKSQDIIPRFSDWKEALILQGKKKEKWVAIGSWSEKKKEPRISLERKPPLLHSPEEKGWGVEKSDAMHRGERRRKRSLRCGL